MMMTGICCRRNARMEEQLCKRARSTKSRTWRRARLNSKRPGYDRSLSVSEHKKNGPWPVFFMPILTLTAKTVPASRAAGELPAWLAWAVTSRRAWRGLVAMRLVAYVLADAVLRLACWAGGNVGPGLVRDDHCVACRYAAYFPERAWSRCGPVRACASTGPALGRDHGQAPRGPRARSGRSACQFALALVAQSLQCASSILLSWPCAR